MKAKKWQRYGIYSVIIFSVKGMIWVAGFVYLSWHTGY